MQLVLAGFGILLLGGVIGSLAGRKGAVVSALAAVIGCIPGIWVSVRVLLSGEEVFGRLAWSMPMGEFYFAIDSLSAVFLIPILLLSMLASVYAAGYLKKEAERRPIGWVHLMFPVLVVSMSAVVCARNAMLFLMSWEVMALSSFFLVMFDSEREEVRRAGWMYLVATHIGTAFIIVLFVWMGRQAGSFDFDRWELLGATAGLPLGAWFLLALIGFGTKAGFWPLHVWLPEAHPAAPSHVSAVMSGVMIKTGIYGLVRMLTFLGPPPAWWGVSILLVGATSGVLGVLFAIAQHDIKRLLAYHSVENIGIIALGIGIGLLGISYSQSSVAVLGFAGAFLHVLNHALFKGLLFMGAGSVIHATGTQNIEHLGGRMKKMPVTGATFLIGSAAISGLPPLNGFVSELLVFVGCFKMVLLGGPVGAVAALAIVSLSLIGGLALACFTKVFGVVFLGECRTDAARNAHPSSASMEWPMVILSLACIGIGLFPVSGFMYVVPAVTDACSISFVDGNAVGDVRMLLSRVSVGVWGLVVCTLVLVIIRKIILRCREIREGATWDCGYSSPTPRMQYTAGSFVQPLTSLFRTVLRTETHVRTPAGFFPRSSEFNTHTHDLALKQIFRPLFEWVLRQAARFQWVQQGRVQSYLLYIFITLAALLAVVTVRG